MTTFCSRCCEPLVNPAYLCGWCEGELRLKAVTALVESRDIPDDPAKALRGRGIEALRLIGHPREQVLHARAQALDGCSIEEILNDLLAGAERVGVVA